ncbi:MAG: hypothetical protein DMG97_39975 [Acidobacteria bacterium]|nr:MAG: hypothetical protein DMG97_39975 [Acidobacteriota bacterium]
MSLGTTFATGSIPEQLSQGETTFSKQPEYTFTRKNGNILPLMRRYCQAFSWEDNKRTRFWANAFGI